MKKMFLIAMGISISMIITGCGESVVECDNEDAKDLVMDIVESEVKNQMSKYTYATSYNGLKNQEYISYIDTRYDAIKAQLANIRTENIDNEMKKSECAAEVVYKNDKVDITYQLSKTTDGNLYAEVFGL